MFDTILSIFTGACGSCIGNLWSSMIEKFFSPQKKIDEHISIKQPPTFEGKLVGRKTDIKKLNKKLRKNQSVWLSSTGGMGKSTLAMVYVHKYRFKYRKTYWLDWKGNLQDTLQDENNIYRDESLNSQAIYDRIILYFRKNAPKSSLLIIDGLDQYDNKEIELIMSFRCKLLITSRIQSNLHVEHPLKPLENGQCKALFESQAEIKISNQQLHKLLALTGKHTLAIKLLARYAQRYSIEQLFTNILNGEDENTDKVSIHGDISNLQNKIEIKDGAPPSSIISYFTKIYALECSQPQKEFLMNLSILPSIDLTIPDLKNLIDKNISEETVSELERLGWLVCRRYKSIYLHPVLSSTIRQISVDEKVDPSIFKNMLINTSLLSSVSLDEFDDFNHLSHYLQCYESIICYYTWKDRYIAQLMMNVSCIHYIQYRNSRFSLKNAKKACSILEKIFKATPNDESAKRQYARALSDISEFYYMDSCKKAIEIEEKALKLKEGLPEGPKDGKDFDKTLDLLKSYSNLMLYHQANFEEGYIETAKEIVKKYENDLKKYKRTRANLYNHYALLLRSCKQSNVRISYSKEAIRLLNDAIRLLNENGATEHYMYPMFINSLGAIYGEVIIYDKKIEKCLTEEERTEYKKCALNNLYKAYFFKKQKYRESVSSIATSQHNLAFFWSEIGHNWIALFYECKATAIRQSINDDNASEPLNLASSLLRLGIIFTAIYEKHHFNYFKTKGMENLKKALTIYDKHCQGNPTANCEKEITVCQKLIEKLNFE